MPTQMHPPHSSPQSPNSPPQAQCPPDTQAQGMLGRVLRRQPRHQLVAERVALAVQQEDLGGGEARRCIGQQIEALPVGANPHTAITCAPQPS